MTDIVFGIGPRINAAGRMDNARTAVRLLTSRDPAGAAVLAGELHARNDARRREDRRTEAEALAIMAAWPDLADRRSTVVFDRGWHQGVIGIAASRLIERVHRPTVVLTASHGQATGSARSVPGFDLHAAVVACAGLLDRFGGHRYAAGLSLPVERIPAFAKRFEEVVRETIDPDLLVPRLRIDSELPLRSATSAFFRVLRQFGPFGPGNPSPVFAVKDVFDTGRSRIVGGDHLRLEIRQRDSTLHQGIAFSRGTELRRIRTGRPFALAYHLEENRWKGSTRLQLRVKDIIHARAT